MVKYKEKCKICRKNWALMSSYRRRFPICLDCEMKVVEKPVEERGYRKLFDIPMEWYKENAFLRSVRYQYGRFGSITDKQEEAFKKTVEELKKTKKGKSINNHR